MLNWRLEEEKYVDEIVVKYLKNIPALSRIFMSNKQLNKNIEYLKEQARQKYRANKLDKYLEEIKKERNRINDLLNNINTAFDEYLEEHKHLISKNIKPFQMEAKPYYNLSEPTLSKLEVVNIHCKPFSISFIQEKID